MSIVYTSLFVLLIFLASGMSFIFRTRWLTPSKLRNYSVNFVLSAFTVAFLFLLVEVYFYTFVVYSDSFSFTLANQRWFETYWQPLNSLGYRDVEPSAQELQQNQLIFVVGDSFVAGQGIKNYRDRFSNRLQDKLGTGWLVLNVAQVGWSTTDEYHALVTHPQKPKILIWSYFVDDIREAANRNPSQAKFLFSELVKLPSNLFKPLIENSYCVNFFYWRSYRHFQQKPESVYWQRLQAFYKDKEIWQVHRQELEAVVNYARQNSILLIPVVFPNLVTLEQSEPITTQVLTLFQTLGTQPIDISPYLRGRVATELVVNNLDAHPNEQVNAEVAEILFERIKVSFLK